MVASVTHGNLYLLSKNQTEIKATNAAEALKGKTVAVVNVAAVPGLTTKAMLEKLGLEVVTDEADKTDENVLVKGITGKEIAVTLNDGLADYVVAPEPAVTNITANVAAIKKVGALHEIYGKYPQAVMVVKTELLQNNKQLVEDIFDAMIYNQTYVLNNPADAADAIFEFMEDGVVPTFAAATITTQTVYGCSINVMNMTEEAIAEINGYIEDIIPLGGATPVAKPFAESFFVDIKA
jgi:ABC-type nitrate/sulfonate/bicarbonate transport system substrate-binding protein